MLQASHQLLHPEEHQRKLHKVGLTSALHLSTALLMTMTMNSIGLLEGQVYRPSRRNSACMAFSALSDFNLLDVDLLKFWEVYHSLTASLNVSNEFFWDSCNERSSQPFLLLPWIIYQSRHRQSLPSASSHHLLRLIHLVKIGSAQC